MLKNRRERLLAIVLGSSLALVAGVEFLDALVLGPLDAKYARLRESQQEVAAQRQRNLRLQRMARDLDEVQHLSLPADPAVATTVYQQWLMELARDLKISPMQVIPGRPVEEAELGYRLPFNIQAEVSESQVNELFETIRQVPVLHSVLSFSLASTNPGSHSLTMNMSLEAVALANVEQAEDFTLSHMMPVATAEQPTVLGEETQAEVSARPVFGDLFTAGYRPPAPQPAPKPSARPQPQRNPADDLILVGTVDRPHRAEVWFYDSRRSQEHIVPTGEQLSFAGSEAVVERIEVRRLILKLADRRYALQLGDRLSDMRPLAAPSSAVASFSFQTGVAAD